MLDDKNSLSEMPFSTISTYELIEHLFKMETVRDEFCQNERFYNNLISASNSDLLKQMEFSYCTDTEFNNLVGKLGGNMELSVFHLNIRSLNKNWRGLNNLLQSIDIDFDILILSEVWNYNLDFYDTIFKNYTFYHTVPTSTNIGGVGIYIKNTFNCNELTHFKLSFTSDSLVESLWLEVSNNNIKYLVAGIYRHPNYNISEFCEQLDNTLERINKLKIPCIIAGDINIDFAKYNTHQDTTNYVHSLLLNNFMPMIVMPTRITSKSATIIDHIYYHEGSNYKKDMQLVSGNLWSDLTDHLPNYVIVVNNRPVSNVDRPYIRLFSDKNILEFKSKLNKINWEPVYNCNNVNSGYDYFDSKIKECFNSSFRLVQMSRKRAKDKKWITPGLKRSICHKNRLFKKWMTTLAKKDEEKYKCYRTQYNKIVDEAEKSYFNELFNTKTNTIKQLWNNLSTVASLGKNKRKNNICQLLLDGKYITDAKMMGDSFNKYFCTIGETLQSKIDSHDNHAYAAYLPSPVKDSMFCTPVTDEEILRIIYRFKNNKAPGPDNIGPRLLKVVISEILDPLSYLCNLSFLTGIVPISLKLAKVVPVYKKGCRSCIENYRPISLLSVFDKILEKLMYSRLYNYLHNNHILYDYQFGFRRHHSTCLALIDVVDQIYQYLDNHELVLGIYLDLQKAFDTVDHDILLQKLFNYGIRGNVHSWFRDYLSDRKQYVCVSGVNSDLNGVTCGVPQGSVLGPLLFLIYVNDIGQSIPFSTIKLFADDTNLFVHSKSAHDLQAEAKYKITLLSDWFIANKLSLNLNKTCYTVFGASSDEKLCLKLNIGNTILHQVESSKYLGVYIDSNLSWQEHIDHVYKKIIKFTSIFYKIRNILNLDILKMIYYAFIHSHLMYGIEIYANTHMKYINKLIILNNYILRILQKVPRDTPIVELYDKFNTLPIPALHKCQILKLVHKFTYHQDKLPNIFLNYFTKNQMIHSYNTRTKDYLHMDLFASSLGQRSLKYKGGILWNSLPDEFKSISSITSFDDKIKTILLYEYKG